MELLSSLNNVSAVQVEIFAIAALLSAGLFSFGFMMGRVSKNRDVKVPMEVLHALAATRFDASHVVAKASEKDAKEDKIEDEIEKILCHKFMRFMMMRAENFMILRRKPLPVCFGCMIHCLLSDGLVDFRFLAGL